jgi:hypothetical protein
METYPCQIIRKKNRPSDICRRESRQTDTRKILHEAFMSAFCDIQSEKLLINSNVLDDSQMFGKLVLVFFTTFSVAELIFKHAHHVASS